MHCSVAVIIFTLLWIHLQNFYIFPLDFIRFVIAFLPKSKCLLILWLQSPSAVILEPKKIKSVTASTFPPSICHEVMGPDTMILGLWMLSFKPTFSLLSFTLIKKLFSSSLLCATRVIWSASVQFSHVWLFVTPWTVAHQASTAYLRLLIFHLAILTPACALSSLGFCMI